MTQLHYLRQGAADASATRKVQALLRDVFGYQLSVDGGYGAQTAATVRTFQGNHGCYQDGQVGTQTWVALLNQDSN